MILTELVEQRNKTKNRYLQIFLRIHGDWGAPRLRQWKTLDEVPSASEGKWVAFIRHAQAGHNVAQLEKVQLFTLLCIFFRVFCCVAVSFSRLKDVR